jgi:hypothetical protein
VGFAPANLVTPIELNLSKNHIEYTQGSPITPSWTNWEKAGEKKKVAEKLARQLVNSATEIKALVADDWMIDEGWLPNGEYKEGVEFDRRDVTGLFSYKYQIIKARVRLRRDVSSSHSLYANASSSGAKPPANSIDAFQLAPQLDSAIQKRNRSWGCFSVTFVILGFAGGLWTLGAFLLYLFLPVGAADSVSGVVWHSSEEKATTLPLIALVWVGCFGIALSIIFWKRAGKRRKA